MVIPDGSDSFEILYRFSAKNLDLLRALFNFLHSHHICFVNFLVDNHINEAER